MVFFILILIVYLLLVIPASRDLVERLVERIKASFSGAHGEREETLDGPIVIDKRANKLGKRPRSYRALLGRTLVAVMFGLVVLLLLAIIIGGLI